MLILSKLVKKSLHYQKNRTNKKRILRSLFNMSHLVFYGILFLLVTLGFVLYNYGIIK